MDNSDINFKQFISLYIAMMINIGFFFNDHLLKTGMAIVIIIGCIEIIMLHIAQILTLISQGLSKLVAPKAVIEDDNPINKIEELPDDFEEDKN